MIHKLNGKRLSDWDGGEAFVAIVTIPLNGVFQPLDAIPTAPPSDFIRPLQQVTIRPDKITELGYIRLGETQGDEANCWIHPSNILIVEVLGRAVEKENNVQGLIQREWRCEPGEGPKEKPAPVVQIAA